MKLTHETFTDFYPMLLSRRVRAEGADDMPNLRLRGVEHEDSDSIPFPRQVSRIGRWQPKPLHEGGTHDAERALEDVQRHLDRLSILVNTDDDDRPRAA
jgi:hypothetical protein